MDVWDVPQARGRLLLGRELWIRFQSARSGFFGIFVRVEKLAIIYEGNGIQTAFVVPFCSKLFDAFGVFVHLSV